MDKELLKCVDKDYRHLLETADKRGLTAISQLTKLNERILEKNITLEGKPIQTSLRPLFVDAGYRKHLCKIIANIMSAVEKVVEIFLSKPECQDFFEMDDLNKELAMINPRYPRKVIQARLDAFLQEEGTIKFFEFNCDSPSGMGWHDQVLQCLEELPITTYFHKHYKVSYEALLPPFMRMLRLKSRQFGNLDDLAFAIVCSHDSPIRSDVELIIEHINSKEKHQAIFADPRDFTYDGKTLRLGDTPIGLIYRDAIQDFTDYLDEAKPVLTAIRDGKVCLVNPFASRVGGLKCVLWFISDERYKDLFTEEERKTIHDTIPWTRLMKEEKTTFHDRSIDLLEFVRNNRECFVLKPNVGYGGRGVTLGREVEQKHWDRIVQSTTKEKWVVQEFVTIPEEEFPVFDPDFRWKRRNVNMNIFAFDGQFGGGYARIADGSVINIHQGAALIPICYVSGRT